MPARQQFEIRLATRRDHAALLTLVERYYRFDSIAFDARVTGRALIKLLRDRSLGRAWVLDAGRALAGYAILTFNYDLEFGGIEGIITDFFIDSRHRRKGLGARMLAVITDYCRSTGIDAIELQVTDQNRRAIQFYKSRGFVKFPRVVMGLDLATTKRA